MHAFLSSADFFSILTFSKNYLRNTIRVSRSEQVHYFVGPDLGLDSLQRLSAVNTSRQIIDSFLANGHLCRQTVQSTDLNSADPDLL